MHTGTFLVYKVTLHGFNFDTVNLVYNSMIITSQNICLCVKRTSKVSGRMHANMLGEIQEGK